MQYKQKISKGDKFLSEVYYIADKKAVRLIIGHNDEVLEIIDMKKSPKLLEDRSFCEMLRGDVAMKCEQYKKLTE